MVAFLATKAAAAALKKAAPIIRDTTNKLKEAGKKQAGKLQQATKKCQSELQKCIQTETAKMKQDLGGIVENTGRNMQSAPAAGGRKRRRSRKRKRSGKRTRKRSGKRTRKRRRRRRR